MAEVRASRAAKAAATQAPKPPVMAKVENRLGKEEVKPPMMATVEHRLGKEEVKPPMMATVEHRLGKEALNCTKLCSTGKGGSVCDCGNMPPAFNVVHDNSVPNLSHRGKVACQHLCSSLRLAAPKACRCSSEKFPPSKQRQLLKRSESKSVASRPAAAAALPLPPVASGEYFPARLPDGVNLADLCQSLCRSNKGGSLCDCNNNFGLPPAVYSSSSLKATADKTAAENEQLPQLQRRAGVRRRSLPKPPVPPA